MEQITNNSQQITEEVTEKAVEANQEARSTDTVKISSDNINAQKKQVNKFFGNFLYEESLEFIPGTLRGKQDPRYVFAKFVKRYQDFDEY